MLVRKLKDFFRCWFIGNFEPILFKTNDVEVVIKKYKKGYIESLHHKIITEYTIKALIDVTMVVVKTPFSKDDKYII